MKPEKFRRVTSDADRPATVARSGVFRRGKTTRELFLVKLSFWAVVAGFFLFLALVLWGLATHGPSQNPMDSGD